MSGPFRRLHHICLVVHDSTLTEAYYESLGIGPWQRLPATHRVHRPATFRTRTRSARCGTARTDLDNVQIQLCQPPELDCPQRRFLDTHGEGVFHLGFEAVLNDAVPHAKAAGLEVLMSGRRDNGTGFVYFDTLPAAGVVWMNRQTQPVQ